MDYTDDIYRITDFRLIIGIAGAGLRKKSLNYFKLSENTEDLQENLQEGNAKQILHVALAELTIQRVRKNYR